MKTTIFAASILILVWLLLASRKSHNLPGTSMVIGTALSIVTRRED